jgi:hypothetical protein
MRAGSPQCQATPRVGVSGGDYRGLDAVPSLARRQDARQRTLLGAGISQSPLGHDRHAALEGRIAPTSARRECDPHYHTLA